ncbi:YcjX family protein [Escherichia coli]
MKRLKNELNALVNRGVDRHLRLAVTGLSRSGKTAFITAMVNQLLDFHAGARLPLLSAVREERLLGVKRIPQRDFGIPHSPMMKDWRSYMAILPPGRRLRRRQ